MTTYYTPSETTHTPSETVSAEPQVEFVACKHKNKVVTEPRTALNVDEFCMDCGAILRSGFAQSDGTVKWMD